MDRDALRDQTKRHVGNVITTGDLAVNDAWYVDRVNEAYRWVGTFQGFVQRPGAKQPQFRSLRFYELRDELSRTFATGLTTNFIAYTATVFALIGLYDTTNNRDIVRRSERHLMRRNPTETGISPVIWAPSGDGGGAGYKIWPLPTVTTAAIEYVLVYPQALASGTTSPVIPETWHPLIHMKAGALAASLLRMEDRAATLENEAMQFIATRRTPVEEAQSGGIRHVLVGRRRFSG